MLFMRDSLDAIVGPVLDEMGRFYDWTEDENGIYSGYITDREYGVLGYEAYDKIKGHIFKKWNKSYQNVVDIFSEDVDKIREELRTYFQRLRDFYKKILEVNGNVVIIIC